MVSAAHRRRLSTGCWRRTDWACGPARSTRNCRAPTSRRCCPNVRSTGASFATPSAWLVDATAAVHLTDAISLEAGLFNLLDETYWEWGDVQGLAAGSPVLDRYSSPGRNVAATLRLHW